MGIKQPTEVRKHQIAKAALRIIASQGLGRFTTAAVAAQVGISEGAMFRHVKNKEEIIGLVIDYLETRLFDGFPQDIDDPLESLGRFIETRIALLSKEPAVLQLFFSRQLEQAAGREGVERLRDMKARSMDFVMECITRAKARDMLKPDLPLAHVMLIIFGTIMAAVSLNGMENLPKTMEEQLVTAGDPWPTLQSLLRR